MRPWYRRPTKFSTILLSCVAACSQAKDSGHNDSPAAPRSQIGDGAVTSRFRYEGLCEASAAATLGDSHFAVASDDSETLTVYERGQSRPAATFTHEGVTDIEGAARIGNTIFWLTSHSLNKDGEDKPKRKVMFATSAGPGPVPENRGTAFTGLRQQVATKLGIAEADLSPWLNIEGVAAAPDSGLLVGLRRAPAEEPRALVVRIDDPFPLVGLPAAPAARIPSGPQRQVWRLDLGGRGIRSLERVGEGQHAYLVLAGPRGDESGTFALFWWDGVGETVVPGPAISFGDMAPEALIAWPDGEIQILGDNEGQGPGHCSEKASDPRPRWFPSVSLRL